jgi:hypothetical protein
MSQRFQNSANEKELSDNENFHLLAANGKQKFVLLGRQTINGNGRLLFQQRAYPQ